MAMTVTDKDRGWKAMMATIKRASEDKSPQVVVGIYGANAAAAHKGGGATVVEVATFNEFGTKHLPARSFIRDTVDAFAKEISTMARRLATSVLDGKRDVRSALDLIGIFVSGKIVQRINSSIPPANAPSTIKRKGSSTTLVDKGQLKGAVSHEVRNA